MLLLNADGLSSAIIAHMKCLCIFHLYLHVKDGKQSTNNLKTVLKVLEWKLFIVCCCCLLFLYCHSSIVIHGRLDIYVFPQDVYLDTGVLP